MIVDDIYTKLWFYKFCATTVLCLLHDSPDILLWMFISTTIISFVIRLFIGKLVPHTIRHHVLYIIMAVDLGLLMREIWIIKGMGALVNLYFE